MDKKATSIQAQLKENDKKAIDLKTSRLDKRVGCYQESEHAIWTRGVKNGFLQQRIFVFTPKGMC